MLPPNQPNTRRTREDIPNFLILKLLKFASFSELDLQTLDTLVASDKAVARDHDIAVESKAPEAIFLIKEGIAARYRMLVDGGRQILTFMIPGDLCDMDAFLISMRDYSICALSHVRVASISRETINRVLTEHPQIALALRRSSIQEHSMLRERITSLGRRDARGRIAYLLCELFWRHEAIGLTEDTFQLPLTQTELGDSLGLTQVHVNRVLKEFHEKRLTATRNRKLVILDLKRLQELAEISSDYLRLASLPAANIQSTITKF